MKFKLTPSLNDGKNDPPPLDLQADTVESLLGAIGDEVVNDYGEPFGPGFTLLIERTA